MSTALTCDDVEIMELRRALKFILNFVSLEEVLSPNLVAVANRDRRLQATNSRYVGAVDLGLHTPMHVHHKDIERVLAFLPRGPGQVRFHSEGEGKVTVLTVLGRSEDELAPRLMIRNWPKELPPLRFDPLPSECQFALNPEDLSFLDGTNPFVYLVCEKNGLNIAQQDGRVQHSVLVRPTNLDVLSAAYKHIAIDTAPLKAIAAVAATAETTLNIDIAWQKFRQKHGYIRASADISGVRYTAICVWIPGRTVPVATHQP